MKLFSIFMFAFMCYATANTYSQKQIVSLNLHRADVNSLFKEIRKQTGLRFVYNEEHVAKLSRFDMKVEKCTVQEVLNKVFKNTSLQYFFEDDVIFIVLQKPTVQADSVKSEVVKGIVVDEKGTVLPGVTIQIKGTSLGVSTNVNGAFQITVLQDTVTLVFSFIGMETTSVKLQKLKAGEVRKELKVVMKEQEITLEDVVITGYANVKKTSFTGSATSVTREELKKVTSGNIISALQVFDPSLRMIKNNLMGSDPNTLPEFYVRGRSGIESVKQLDKINATTDDISQYALTNNPNTPIFIMDGYEVSVEKVYDLDLNRVESVTILKDAAATAVYGSRASNGVVVIETVAPSPGRLRMAYYFTGSVTAPDLSDYNLMNAREKLEAELAAGLLDAESPNGTSGTNDYFQRLSDYRNTLLYSDASRFPINTHAAFQICFSNPISAVFLSAILSASPCLFHNYFSLCQFNYIQQNNTIIFNYTQSITRKQCIYYRFSIEKCVFTHAFKFAYACVFSIASRFSSSVLVTLAA